MGKPWMRSDFGDQARISPAFNIAPVLFLTATDLAMIQFAVFCASYLALGRLSFLPRYQRIMDAPCYPDHVNSKLQHLEKNMKTPILVDDRRIGSGTIGLSRSEISHR